MCDRAWPGGRTYRSARGVRSPGALISRHGGPHRRSETFERAGLTRTRYLAKPLSRWRRCLGLLPARSGPHSDESVRPEEGACPGLPVRGALTRSAVAPAGERSGDSYGRRQAGVVAAALVPAVASPMPLHGSSITAQRCRVEGPVTVAVVDGAPELRWTTAGESGGVGFDDLGTSRPVFLAPLKARRSRPRGRRASPRPSR